jgi:hypothetical protein
MPGHQFFKGIQPATPRGFHQRVIVGGGIIMTRHGLDGAKNDLFNAA